MTEQEEEHQDQDQYQWVSPEQRWAEMHRESDPLLARLDQVHQKLHQGHLLDPVEELNLQRERRHYLSQAGPFEPYDFLRQMGFEITQIKHSLPGTLADMTVDGMQVRIATGVGMARDKMTLTYGKAGERGKDIAAQVPLPTGPDEVYALLNKLKLYKLTSHLAKPKFEAQYIKSKKK